MRSRLELQGSESNRPPPRLMRPGRAQPSLHDQPNGRVCDAGMRLTDGVTQRQRSVQSRAAEGLNLAGRFWRPARSQIAAQEPRIVVSDNRPQSVRERTRGEDGGRGVRAPVWNRTSISCASGRRHHQIGFESKIVAGDQGWSLPGHGHRRLFGCQRSSPAVAGVVAAVHERFRNLVSRQCG